MPDSRPLVGGGALCGPPPGFDRKGQLRLDKPSVGPTFAFPAALAADLHVLLGPAFVFGALDIGAAMGVIRLHETYFLLQADADCKAFGFKSGLSLPSGTDATFALDLEDDRFQGRAFKLSQLPRRL
jgi:hypothetical protein